VTNPYEPPGTFELPDEPERNLIQSLSNKSVLFGILGLLCCGLIFGPLAISYANRAEAQIILDESGASHGSTYKVGRALGYVSLVLWVLGFLLRIVNLLV
jgi:hypothetical protein